MNRQTSRSGSRPKLRRNGRYSRTTSNQSSSPRRRRKSNSSSNNTGGYFRTRKSGSATRSSRGSSSSRSSSRLDNRRKYYGRRSSGGRKKFKDQTIDIQTFIQKASVKKPRKQHKITHTFADFGFCDLLQNNLEKQEYTSPTPIQDQAIKPIMKVRDVIGLANTGTGKTSAFLLPLINRISADKSQKALIIAPTRELAIQIDAEFRKFAIGMNISSTVCIGGAPIYRQQQNLRRGSHVVIGTPGRLQDLSNRNQLDFGSFNNIVLDEVDRMLDMGFIDIIKMILNEAPTKRQLLFFSATLPETIKKLVHTFLIDPVTVQVQTGKTTENVEQNVVRVKDHSVKFDKLVEILGEPEIKKVLIFNETKRGAEDLANKLYRTGYKADSIHGDKRQRERQRSLTRFRDNRVNILVATDIAARGLDIKDVTHVINYTIPQTFDDYIHRIGRTGRGSNKGIALTFV